MNHEEAEKWVESNGFFAYTFKTRGFSDPATDVRTIVEGMITGQEKTWWDVSGFAWKKDRRNKVRIHQVDESLVVAVDRAKARFEEVGKW